ncbi:hypothetical protein OGH69_11355 [Flavobacterium sp. MFBS3-15]|uniref:hypothetical protein n=1 Tax=Flavobacterium sp. MFBS3-15 TaxID=2989816 RepID=UPI00223552FF|nr:hypothetical protein [Flavobacterium sp. MFBS3-15]MCW4469565.1 hypothetical protein [Flavobacterium sp. MFBS3-15]
MSNIKLYLHVGTEKTGSSFLQALLSQNRDKLWAKGIHYPSGGKYERGMKAGRISPGNGKYLWEILMKKDWNRLKHLLQGYKAEAEKRNSSKILISNENIVEAFSQEATLYEFTECCKNLSIDISGMLLVLRDPVDQALSLYKHRAKSGNIASIDKWLEEGYFLPRFLFGFFQNVEESKTHLLVQKYHKNSAILSEYFFKDWLGIEVPPHSDDTSVNPSLTLSELQVIKQVKTISPNLVPFYYKRMLTIPVKQKAEDKFLKKKYLSVISSYLVKYNSLWNHCNDMIFNSDKLQLPVGEDIIQDSGSILCFSEIQTEAFVLLMKESNTLPYKIDVAFNQRIRPKLAKIKWAVIDYIKKGK